jgi:very-short-patch-repair endonuclease
VIEIDGDSHVTDDQAEYDKARTRWLAKLGYKVIRFSAQVVEDALEEVIEEIRVACQWETQG